MPIPDDFTGERFLPSCRGEIWAEHWHRYVFAAQHVANCDVLDAACGEGYGADWLARHARSVTGLDVDAPTIVAAREKYHRPGLRFEIGSVAALPFADASFDRVVSFETLEHLAEQEEMLAEFRRVLRPDGVLIISTPNKVEYSERRDFQNEYHVRELHEDEFHALLSGRFGAQRWYGQRLLFNSAVWPFPDAGRELRARWIAAGAEELAMPPPMYFVAFAAATESMLPTAKGITLLADPHDVMYGEYTQTVSRTRKLEQLVGERDRQIEMHAQRMRHIEAVIAERDAQLAATTARAMTMETLIAERERLIIERDGQISAMNATIRERERLIAERDEQIAAGLARSLAAEQLVDERDRQLEAANERQTRLEQLLLDRERIVIERDAQLAAVNAARSAAEQLIAERERIIVERDAQLAAANATLATAGQLIAERERIIVERDSQLKAANDRISSAETVVVERDRQLADLSQHSRLLERALTENQIAIAGLTERNAQLRAELARRAGWGWWLTLPFRKIRQMVYPRAATDDRDSA